MFLKRCLFTMFAEDIGLLPKILQDDARTLRAQTGNFRPVIGALWEARDVGGFAHVIEARAKRFNGSFFCDHLALPLGRETIVELRTAAECDWQEVDPSIFGTLLE